MLTTYGPWAIFTFVLIEDFGVPVPGEIALITAAILASQGKLSIEWLLPVAWPGAVLGDNTGYAIWRYGGRRVVLRFGRRVGIGEAHLSWVERLFAATAVPTFMLCNSFGAALWVWSEVLVSTGLAVIFHCCCIRWEQPLSVLSSSWA